MENSDVALPDWVTVKFKQAAAPALFTCQPHDDPSMDSLLISAIFRSMAPKA